MTREKMGIGKFTSNFEKTAKFRKGLVSIMP